MKKIAVIIFCIFLIALGVFIVTLSERQSRYFEVYSDSLHGGGWVPKIFPTDIRDIHEQHDIDSNEVWLAFKLGSTLFLPETFGYKPVSAGDQQNIRLRLPSYPGLPSFSNWWFGNFGHNRTERVFSGPCYHGGSNEPHMQGYILIRDSAVYWWCQSL